MSRTTADMIQDYITGISDIDKRIGELDAEIERHKNNSRAKNELCERRRSLWSMRGDMAWALFRASGWSK